MLNLDQVNAAITEAGPLEEEILAIHRVGDDHWAIEFESIIIELECDAEKGRLMFSGSIGSVPEENRITILESLLSYSLLWRETHGLRIGLTQPENEAILLVDLASEEIQPSVIALVATNLAERALLWQGLLATQAIPEPEVQIDGLSTQFIKL